MAKQGKVRLSGRFPAGTPVRLVKVEDAGTLRAEGGEEVASKKVGKDGSVEFTGDAGSRYFITGYVNGSPLEVRVTMRESADVNSEIFQAPVAPDRVRLADGSWLDEAPEQRKAPLYEAAPDLAQDQIGDDKVQRSATVRGTAHPFDPEESSPLPDIDEKSKGQVLMSDTESGTLHPAEVGPQRQEDVPAGTVQRSDTPTGVATPLPRGGAVKAQEEKESSDARSKRGTPQQAAAAPLGVAKVRNASGTKHVSNQPLGLTHPGDLTRTGLDAMGQPVYEDVARAAGVSPAKKPAEAVRGEPKDVAPPKTPETSGQAAAREATPRPTRRTADKPVEGGKADDQEGT